MEATATKKVIQRNLPLNIGYSLRSIVHGSVLDGDGSICDNCNALISNIAAIRDDNGKVFNVGLDCMKTLTMKPAWISNGYSSEDMMYEYNCFTRFIGHCNKVDATIEPTEIYYIVTFMDGKGKKQQKFESPHIIDQFLGLDKFRKQYQHKLTH